MVWPFTSSEDKSSKQSDPYKDLDPSLRAFLEKESPVKYKPKPPPPPAPSSTSETPSKPLDPSRNRFLYKDGRYASLWSTYVPQSEIDSVYKSDQEKIQDILDAFKSRRSSIGSAALENCSLQQEALHNCYRTGSWKSTLTMCRKETHELQRCYTMNQRFLKALGYLSDLERSEEVEEQIQMHADLLYEKMIEREKLVKEAKDRGESEPEFPSLFEGRERYRDSMSEAGKLGGTSVASSQSVAEPASRANGTSRANETIRASGTNGHDGARQGEQDAGNTANLQTKELTMIDPKSRKEFEDRIKDMSTQEKEIEERVFAAEIAAKASAATQLEKQRVDALEAKRIRKEKGQESIGDRVSGWFGW